MRPQDILSFRGAIFDLDGTLIESNGVWSSIDKRFLGRRGIAVPPDYFKAVSVKDFPAAAIYTKERFSLPETTDEIMAEWHEMAREEYANNIAAVEGAPKFLRKVRALGIKLALATASTGELYEPVLRRLGVLDLFDAFATTTEVPRGKGHPDVYLLACRRLGLSPGDCIVFEDIIEGIRGAKQGGFATAACLNSHYRRDWEEMKAEADWNFRSYVSQEGSDKENNNKEERLNNNE